MKVLTNNKYYSEIADIIREQNGTSNTYTPPQMVSALKDLFYEEVEGVPPLNFQGIGENLLDYRIDGASGGVGERTKNFINITASTSNYQGVQITTNKDKSITLYGTASNNAWITIQTNNILDVGQYILTGAVNNVLLRYQKNVAGYGYDDIGEGRNINITEKTTTGIINLRIVENVFYDNVTIYPMIRLATEDNTYEPYGYKVPVVVSSKNFLQNTATTQVRNGVAFTINKDKSISCNGTASSNAFFKIGDIQLKKNCIMSGCPEGGANNSYVMRLYNNGSVFKTDSGDGVLINSEIQNGYVEIRIAAGYTCDNLTFYPMIRLAEIEDDTYEPYHEPTTTNIYLDKPIEAKANIPSEYTEVEYLESTGTQYIDTNYTPVQGDDLEFKNVTINTFNGALFSAGIESYQLILLGLGSVCYYKYFQTGNAVASSFSTITNGNIKVLNGNLYINNVLKAEADYGGAVDTTLNIFQRANNTSNLIGKIGEIIISNNGIIKRDFIPCYRKSDNVAGLYDLVNNTFYTNQGTGNFIVGPIKENESISLSDTNTNISTIRGTNILSVDTTVQPSKVYVKVRKESQYETIMRERYEEAQAQLDALESGGE